MKRWRINLYTIWFAQILSLTSFGLGLPFIPFYIQELGVVDPDRIKLYTGLLSSIPAVGMGIMAPVWGILADKWGKKLMLLRAMFFAVFILIGMGLSANANQLLLFRTAQGMLTGTVTAASTLVASSTPQKHLSFGLGFLSSSTFIGLTAGPALGGFIAESAGYRTSFLIGAFLMLLDFLLVLFIVKENKSSTIQTPTDTIQKPKEQKISKQENKKDKKHIPLLSIFTPTIIGMMLVLLCMRVSRTVFRPYLPLYIQHVRTQIEGTARITGIISSLIGMMTALSGLTLSRLGDRLNKLKLLKILLIFGIILSAPLIFTNTILQLTIIFCALFFTIGGIEPLVMSLNSQNISSDKHGMLFGAQTFVVSIGWALSPVMGSYISINYSIKSILIIIPIFLSLALVNTIITSIKAKRKSCYQSLKN